MLTFGKFVNSFGRRVVALLTLVSFIVYSSNYNIGGGGTVPGPMIGGTQGSILFIDPNDTVAQDNANLFFNNTSDSVGIQTAAPLAPLHVVGATGSQINSVTTASVTTASESLNASPTGAITLIAQFGALMVDSTSQNTSGSGYTASNQTIDYEIYQCVFNDLTSNYYCSATGQTGSFTDTLGDNSPFSVIINMSSVNAEATHFLIKKQINGAGFNESVLVSASTSYEDSNFSGTASYNAWPTQYIMSFTVPSASSGLSGQEINIGSGSLTESNVTYDFEVRECANVNGTRFCEQTGTSGNFTDANMGQTFDLQIDWTAGSGDDQVIRISNNGGSTWDYFFVGSGGATQYVYTGQANDTDAQTAWSNDIASAQVQYAFKAFAKSLNAANNAVIYSPSANNYYGTITTPNVYYIFKHVLTGSIPSGAKIIADYNTGVTNGQDITNNTVYDIGYSSWGSGTTNTPTTYAFADGTTRYFKLVGFSSPIYSPTPIVVNATTSGTGKYFTGSFSYPSGVTTVKILISSDGVTYTGSKTFTSPTTTFTYDSADAGWGGNTTITPTASVPTAVRIDRAQSGATDVPQLSIIEAGGSGNRLSAIGFGVAASSAAAATYQSNIIGYSSTGFIGIGSARLVGYTGAAQTTESWNLGSATAFNINKSSSNHPTFWATGTEPLAYFYSAGDTGRGTLFLDDDGATSISDAKFVISPQAGGTVGYVFDRPSGSSTGDAMRIQSSGSYLGGIGADSSIYINRASVDSNAFLSFGGSTSKASIKLGGTLKSSPTALGLEGSSDDLYFTLTTGTARKKVTLSDITFTSNRIPFATTNGRLTDDADLSFDSGDTLYAAKHNSASGSASAVAYQLGGQAGLGLYRPNSSEIGFATSNTLRAKFDSSGRFGLGVSSPTAFLHLLAGTATANTAPLKFNSGTLLATPEVGAIEFNSDKFYGTITTGAAREEFTLNDNALTSGRVPLVTTNGRLTDDSDMTFATDTLTVTNQAISTNGTLRGAKMSATLASQTATGTVANTVTETAMNSTVTGSLTIPANQMIAGRSYRIKGMGYHSSTGNPTITIRVKLGSTTICTMTGTSGNSTNDTFEVDNMFTVRTTGASGTIFSQGKYEEVHGSGLRTGCDNTGTSTIDTTASQAVTVTAEWGTAAAGNTISLSNLVLEELN
jgi:hypothetical protein